MSPNGSGAGRRSGHRRAAAILLLLTSAASSRAQAQPTSAEKGQREYEDCKRRFLVDDYVQAIAQCKRAFIDDPDPAILYTLAQAYRRTGDHVEAADMYRRFLELEGGSYPPERRSVVEGLLAQEENAAATTQVAASKPSSGSASVPPLPTSAATRAASAVPVLPSERRAWYRDPVGDSLLGAGLLAEGASGVLFLLADSWGGRAGSEGQLAGFTTDVASARRYEDMAIGLAIGGGLLCAGGVAWDALHPSGEENRVTGALWPGGGAVAWGGRF